MVIGLRQPQQHHAAILVDRIFGNDAEFLRAAVRLDTFGGVSGFHRPDERALAGAHEKSP